MVENDITGHPLVVSNKSTQTIVMALVCAWREGVISDEQYKMTYAEVCEIGFLPQSFGGHSVDPDVLQAWKIGRSWS